jgi:hypothetical protein
VRETLRMSRPRYRVDMRRVLFWLRRAVHVAPASPWERNPRFARETRPSIILGGSSTSEADPGAIAVRAGHSGGIDRSSATERRVWVVLSER